MKKVICISVVAILVFSSLSYAQVDVDGPMRKLGRGLANIATCPMEIAKQVGDANYEDGPVAALTYGFIKGLFMTGVRAVVGGYEVVTFPIPFPKNYDPILRDPEFFLSDGLF